MSPRRPPTDAHELGAALAARDYTTVALSALLVIGTVANAIRGFAYWPPGQLVLTALATALLIAALVPAPRTRTITLALAAQAVLITSTVFSDPKSNARLSASTFLFLFAALSAISAPRRWRPAVGVAAALLWIATTGQVPLHVHIGELLINVRYLTLVQFAVFMWWVTRTWRIELSRIVVRDRLSQARSENRLAAIALHERVRVWRESLTWVHETTLNDIRSVLDVHQVDWTALRDQLAQRHLTPPPERNGRAVEDVLAECAAAWEVAMAPIAVPTNSPVLRADQATSLRAVLNEVVRNLIRHAHCTRLEIRVQVQADVVRITLLHDGQETGATDLVGIGLGVILNEELPELDAQLTQLPGSTELAFPLHGSDRARRSFHTNAWRTVFAIGAAGNVVGGTLHFIVSAFAYGTAAAVQFLSMAVLAALAGVAAWRQRPLAPTLSALGALAATVAPLATIPLISDCTTIEFSMYIATLSLIGGIGIAIWSRSPWWLLIILGNGLGMARLSAHAIDVCFYRAVPGFIATLIGPVFLLLILGGIWWSSRQQRAAEVRLAEEVRETVAAQTAVKFGAALHSSVRAANATMRRAALARRLTDDDRNRLRCLDAEIRASVQVDPETSGALALAARKLVLAATARGNAIRVLSLRDSGNHAPIPMDALAVGAALLRAADDGSATIQILSGTDDESLVITTSHAAAGRSELATRWRTDFHGGSAEFDNSDPESPAVFIIRKSAGT